MDAVRAGRQADAGHPGVAADRVLRPDQQADAAVVDHGAGVEDVLRRPVDPLARYRAEEAERRTLGEHPLGLRKRAEGPGRGGFGGVRHPPPFTTGRLEKPASPERGKLGYS